MIQTKIQCDSTESHYYRSNRKEVELSEAVATGWWEISVQPGTVSGTIQISRPKTEAEFQATSKHACCEQCAREIVKWGGMELIPDTVENKV